MITVYISIGNSDDKLTQDEWGQFWAEVDLLVRQKASRVHGAWFSSPVSRYQNACWCVEIQLMSAHELQLALAPLAYRYRQDGIAWAAAETTFIPER